MKSTFLSIIAGGVLLIGTIPVLATAYDFTNDNIPEVKWDAKSLLIDGDRVTPVMGEIHYSRLPENEWRSSVRKMKEGGVTLVATYVFWNHIEQNEGKFDWSGQRNLRKFLEICKEEGMPVVLRVGPFCHGEARNGGIPDWIFDKGIKSRSEDPAFLDAVAKLYRQIFTQIQGLQWKDGGPVMACQFDNEYRGHGSYLMKLKSIAEGIGFDLPFYTRTGWPELKTPVPYGEMVPLYGDYADGFWERSIEPTAGNYYKAFNFKGFRSSTAIASEQLKDQKEKLTEGDEQYPYFTCELGGGMMGAYHRRPWIYPEDAYSLAVVKLGSGSNLLGYYMYHGGTNPESDIYLNETQRTKATNYNDLPVKNYDFQAPLGEFGQPYPHYFTLRKLHLFMQDYGDILAPMEAFFPAPQDIAKGDDSGLRYSYRTDGDRGFVFINNYERLQNLSEKKGIQFDACGVKFPSKPITIPAGTTCIFPINIDGIKYATAQLVAKRNGKIYLEQIPGIPTEIALGKKVIKNAKALGPDKPIADNIYLLTSEQASQLFLPEHDSDSLPSEKPQISKSKEAGSPRTITIGVNKAAESPEDADFDQAAVYTISNLPKAQDRENILLRIDYRGDVARLYCDGKLIADNFYNGRPMLYGLWRLPEDAKKLELRILPLQENMPVYFPAEADTTPGEEVMNISLIKSSL
ncbi:MAG: beta-galactosidase [Muribaculaceae bacterium]|nr:beta-galactosidase [Muribaculaceae bacterium]